MGYLLPIVGGLNDCGSTAGLGQGRLGRGAGMSGKIGLVLPKGCHTGRIPTISKGSTKPILVPAQG